MRISRSANCQQTLTLITLTKLVRLQFFSFKCRLTDSHEYLLISSFLTEHFLPLNSKWFTAHSQLCRFDVRHLGPVAWTSLNFKWHLKSFCIRYYVILNVILHAFYEWNYEKKPTYHHSDRKTHTKWRLKWRTDGKWSQVSLKFKWRSCNRPLMLKLIMQLKYI